MSSGSPSAPGRNKAGFFHLRQSLLVAPCRAALQNQLSAGRGPTPPLEGQTHLALSHKRRVKLNGLCQKVAVERHRAEHPEGRVVAIVPKEDAETRGTSSVTVTFPGVDGVFLTVGQARGEL